MLPEIEQHLVIIEDLMDHVGYYINGLSPDALNWRPLEGSDNIETNSLAGLVTHIAGSNKKFMIQVIAGKSIERDRDAEFATVATSAEELVTLLQDNKQQIREVLTPLRNEGLGRDVEMNNHKVSTRWVIMWMIEHTALHLGHMQLTYQMGHSGEAGASPGWFDEQRVG